jgi:hypothetical protein
MSDLNLLVFGCVVTFIGVAGAYVYIRESFTAGAEPPRESKSLNPDAVKHEI